MTTNVTYTEKYISNEQKSETRTATKTFTNEIDYLKFVYNLTDADIISIEIDAG